MSHHENIENLSIVLPHARAHRARRREPAARRPHNNLRRRVAATAPLRCGPHGGNFFLRASGEVMSNWAALKSKLGGGSVPLRHDGRIGGGPLYLAFELGRVGFVRMAPIAHATSSMLNDLRWSKSPVAAEGPTGARGCNAADDKAIIAIRHRG